MTTKDLVEAARDYAKHDEYSVTRNYINALCNEIDRLRTLNANVFSKIQDNTETYRDAERYRWLRSASWDVDTITKTQLARDSSIKELPEFKRQ